MTAVLERAEPSAAPPPAPKRPGRVARWWAGWRVAVRLARRDAWRGKGRATLVLLLIALPVAAVVASLSYDRATIRANSSSNQALLSLGPTADARVVVGRAPASQAVDLSSTSTGDGPRPTQAQILAALPPGSSLVDVGGQAPVVLEVGAWGIPTALSISDVRDPLNASRWRLRDGRLPSTATEIALGSDEAHRLQARLGDTVAVTATSGAEHVVRLTLVGLVGSRTSPTGYTSGVVLPGVLAADPSLVANGVPLDPSSPLPAEAATEFLVRTSRALTWTDVRALNAIGALVASRSVLESPPSFCAVWVTCLDRGPEPQSDLGPSYVSDTQVADAARAAALAVVVLVLIVLQVALLAGPAFAVQLRRRQRELGLVGASGGTAADLRRAVLASGLVLGVAGGVLGIAAGWAVVALLGGVLPWAPLADDGVALGLPPLPWYVVGVAAIGVIAAVVASLVPAVLAGRGDTIDALRGRRPLPALRTRTPVIGLLIGFAGIAVVAYGRTKVDGLVMGVGIIVGELGLVLVMPWLVVQCGRLGRFLTLSPRLAVRDAGRHRLRTAAAACAIAAAAAAAVASSTWAVSSSYIARSTDVAYPDGTLAVQVYDDTTSPSAARAAELTRRTTAAIDTVAPGSPTAVLVPVIPKDAPAVPQGYPQSASVGCVVPATPQETTAQQSGISMVASPTGFSADGLVWQNCGGRTSTNGSLGGEVLLLSDPADLAMVLGPLAGDLTAARSSLERGGAVVLQPGAVDDKGLVRLQSAIYPDNAPSIMGDPFTVPAVEVVTGALPASVILGPKAVAPGGAAASLHPDAQNQVLVTAPSVGDQPDRPTVADQMSIALSKARVDGSVVHTDARGVADDGAVQLAMIGAATLLLALLAGLMVTALALADGRSDLTTLAAVGAEPRVRRRIAASSAGFVAALGCATGVVSGLVLAWLLNPLFNRFGSQVVVVRWWLVAFVLVGIPAITAGVAWLTTRSRIVLTRRRD